ncbi:hypothetical protein AAMO2058_000519700 [Amorphochlora amoebiformis]|mmetsp:Transcript_32707/g.52652  ORF Transcript_32707/g.52652 Transcript_32707/m.52652 type:complete len:167 (-) Transcript_32707:248-748(-)
MVMTPEYAEMLRSLTPVALGCIAMIYSNIHSIGIMNKPRYSLKDFKHPYKPWTDEHSDERSFRGFKASQNQIEWLVYSIPIFLFSSLFAPAFPSILGLNTGLIAQWLLFANSLLYAKANVDYIKGYIKSSDERMPGFILRTRTVRVFLYTSLAAIACFLAKLAGFL